MQLTRAATILGVGVVLCLGVGAVKPAVGQPVQVAAGRVELGLVLRQLNTVGTFMMATAHPDDENNALLALLAKGRGLRTVLVTATRGAGGQNEIGAELFDALAVLRTEELLAAHRLDGAEQYFTRAVDFGYSFSRDETFKLWGLEAILADFVRMIRTVRPEVIAAMSPDGRGGGQHHQASAVLAQEAYAAAADQSRFPEQLAEGLRPWQPKKFYFSTGFPFRFGGASSTSDPDITRIDLGAYDPLLGRTYAELGGHARSMHKCQGISPLIMMPGPAAATYRLVDTTIPDQADAAETSLFDGIDTSIEGLAGFAGTGAPRDLVEGLATVARHARVALQAFEREGMRATGEPVLLGLAAVRRLRDQLGTIGLPDGVRWEIDFRLVAKERQFERAVVLAHGLRIDAFVNDGIVTPAQRVTLSALVANHGDDQVVVKAVRVTGFDGATACAEQIVVSADVYRCSSGLRIPDEVPPTNIHWRHVPGAARYEVDDDVPFGVPFRPTLFRATFVLEFGSVTVSVDRPVEYRYGDDIFAGEKRSAIHVVPKFSVDVSPAIAIIPRGTSESRDVRVTVTNGAPGPAEGEVTLALPAGWTAMPQATTVRFTREDESRTVRFAVTPGQGGSGEYRIRAVVSTPEATFDRGYQLVEYPHIGRRHLVHPAESTIKLLNVEVVPDLTVGYVEGVGDAVPQAIEQLGARVELIDADQLAWGDLSRFDVIVTGVRAYERRADLRANNDRLLQYVDAGGTVIVQYNKFEFNDAQYGPFEARVSRNRVTDQQAPVRVLVPDHPVFRWPNQIDETTWSDWVQERGLYFLGDKAPAYVDLVELEDTFEWNPGVKRGALVEARRGQGRWIYVGLGLWRQLPAGTVGAYQLLANLLSLGAAQPIDRSGRRDVSRHCSIGSVPLTVRTVGASAPVTTSWRHSRSAGCRTTTSWVPIAVGVSDSGVCAIRRPPTQMSAPGGPLMRR